MGTYQIVSDQLLCPRPAACSVFGKSLSKPAECVIFLLRGLLYEMLVPQHLQMALSNYSAISSPLKRVSFRTVYHDARVWKSMPFSRLTCANISRERPKE